MRLSLETVKKYLVEKPHPSGRRRYAGSGMMRRLGSGNPPGLTLIELLFSMCILGIVATAIFKLFMAHHATYLFQQSLVDGQQNGRIALSSLARELRWAGYGLLDTDPAGLVRGQSCHPWTSSRSHELVNEHSLRLLSNLHGVETRLSREALPGDIELFIPDDRNILDNRLIVSKGQAFERNDTIYIYRLSSASGGPQEPLAAVDVECHKLISNGISGRIRLAPGDSIRRPFPPGSPIHVVNALQYFLDPGNRRLMRRLDGGTDVLADGVEDVVFSDLGNRVVAQLTLKGRDLHASDHVLAVGLSVTLRNR